MKWSLGKSKRQSYSVELSRGPLEIPVVRHPRRRRMSLRVREQRVELALPMRCPEGEILAFLESAKPWLEVAGLRAGELARLANSNSIWYLGVELAIERGPVDYPEYEETRHTLMLPQTHPLSDKDLALLWIHSVAVAEAEPLVLRLAEVMQVSVGEVRVRNQKSRWGSCSHRGTISLNWRLWMAPPSVIEYLVIHELAHRKEMNHSSRFWAVVARFCPTYQDSERTLKAMGHRWMALQLPAKSSLKAHRRPHAETALPRSTETRSQDEIPTPPQASLF